MNIPNLKYKHKLEIGDGYDILIYDVQYGIYVDLKQNYIDINEQNNKKTLDSIDMNLNEIILDNQKEKPQGINGDLNGDGDITAKDLNMLFSYLNGKTEFTAEQIQKADVTGDGQVTAKDLNRLYSHINGKNPLL